MFSLLLKDVTFSISSFLKKFLVSVCSRTSGVLVSFVIYARCVYDGCELLWGKETKVEQFDAGRVL